MKDLTKLAQDSIRKEAEAVLGLLPLVDDSFLSVAKRIYGCKGKVVFTGVGKSGVIGLKIAGTLSSTGTPSIYMNPMDLAHGNLGAITKDDIIVVLSKSGNTKEIVDLLPYLKKRAEAIVALTLNRNSELVRYSDFSIVIPHLCEAGALYLVPSSSTTAMLVLGDVLACILVEMRGFTKEDFINLHPGGELGKEIL